MAALSITVAEVQPGAGPFYNGIAGATITAGQSVYVDATVNTVKLADSDASLATATCMGIACHGALTGQPIQVQIGGSITIGATAAMSVGTVYCVGTGAGSIVPNSDLANPSYVSLLGVASTAAVLVMSKFNSSVIHA